MHHPARAELLLFGSRSSIIPLSIIFSIYSQYIFNISIFFIFYLIFDSLQASSCLGGNREAKSIEYWRRLANVGWAEFKPHLRGSLGHGPNQHKRAVPRRGHGAKSLTQHRHAGPSANSGSVDTVPEPSGCTPLSLSSCDHRQAAEMSASGCKCSLPEMEFFCSSGRGWGGKADADPAV